MEADAPTEPVSGSRGSRLRTQYCLMSNHVHMVGVPPDALSIELAVGRTHWRCSQAINRLRRRSGHLWRGRSFSCPLYDEQALAAVRYVERNLVRAKRRLRRSREAS